MSGGVPRCQTCGAVATRIGQKSNMCDLHYRVRMMRSASRARGKSVPTRSELEAMISDLHNMECPACKQTMVLHRDRGTPRSVVTIQHWPDGTVGLLCLSCNNRHGSMRDPEMFAKCGPHQKHCYACRQILPLDAFYEGGGYGRRGYVCRQCTNLRWAIRQDEKYAAAKAKEPQQ